MKKSVFVLLLSLLIISAPFASAQSQNKEENHSDNWIESQKLSFFLGRQVGHYNKASELIVDIELPGKGYKDNSNGIKLTMNQQNDKNRQTALPNHRTLLNNIGFDSSYENNQPADDVLSEAIEVIKEVMEVTKVIKGWTKRMQEMRMSVSSKYELYIRTDIDFDMSEQSGLIEFELIEIM
jgi:FKBP-type peptidyl-prolyl cis-trans isomerase